MDLTHSVAYRGLALNSPVVGPKGILSGIQLAEASYGAVAGVGFTEKRALGDGRDASDVFLDGRRIMLRGTVYGLSRAELYDLLQDLQSALSPTAAFNDEPGDYGYMPLSFQRPTLDLISWPTGEVPLCIYCRPMATPSFSILRDATGGAEDRGGSVPWQAMLEAKDPRVYVNEESEVDIVALATSGAGSFNNRGDYPAPLNILLVVNAHAGTGRFDFTGAGAVLRIILPASDNTIVYRYDGQLKVLTTEENGEENLRMDLLVHLSETTHPLVQPGSSAWTWASTATGSYVSVPMQTNSRFWFQEAFA